MTIKDIEDSIINNNNIPKHIAIIMDGNGRWAKAHSLPRIAGHKEGIDSVRAITKKCGDIGVKHLSLYTCLLYTSPSPRDKRQSRMPSSA